MTDEDEPFEDREPPKRSIPVAIAVLEAKVRLLAWMVKNNLVSKHEFAPVKLLVYGATALVLSSVVGAIVAYTFRQ